MNKKQMKVVWVVLGILLVMSLFPMRETTDGGTLKRGFAFTQRLQTPVHGGSQYTTWYSKVDLETTLAQMLPVVILGVGFVLAFRDKKKDT